MCSTLTTISDSTAALSVPWAVAWRSVWGFHRVSLESCPLRAAVAWRPIRVYFIVTSVVMRPTEANFSRLKQVKMRRCHCTTVSVRTVNCPASWRSCASSRTRSDTTTRISSSTTIGSLPLWSLTASAWSFLHFLPLSPQSQCCSLLHTSSSLKQKTKTSNCIYKRKEKKNSSVLRSTDRRTLQSCYWEFVECRTLQCFVYFPSLLCNNATATGLTDSIS